MTALLIVVVVAALVFAVTNGFHDTSTAIASSVSTGALTPGVAVIMAAGFNALGTMAGIEVARTIDRALIPVGDDALVIILCGLLSAIAWNLVTWWAAIPSSSTHAIVGGLAGAGLAAGAGSDLGALPGEVIAPLFVFPVAILLLAVLVMSAVLWGVHRQPPVETNRRLRQAQSVAAAAVALGHGMQDGQKVIGVMLGALAAGGVVATGAAPPIWVSLSAAAAMGLGTLMGGWRITKTLGRRVTDLDTASGFAAESLTAVTLLLSTSQGVPVSTTYTVTSAVTGVGITARGVHGVRWRLVRRIVVTWLVTVPVTALAAAFSYLITSAVSVA